MIVIQNYPLAILLCIMAMVCWGSWQNTQNLIGKPWRFELYYWDFVVGILLTSLVSALTIGSLGSQGRTFTQDIMQAELPYIGSAMLGGAIWNLGTLLLIAAISIAGMSVAFPIGGGIGWLLGIIVNYNSDQVKNPQALFIGLVVLAMAIFFSMISYKKLAKEQQKTTFKGILLSFLAGLLIAFFYKFVASSLAANNIDESGKILLEAGKLSPYTAVFLFSIGALLCTIIFNPFFMRKPVQGEPVAIGEYFKGSTKAHLYGLLGGAIWCAGNILSFMAANTASPAISYGLSNAAPLVATLWGIFAWKEFKAAPKGTNLYLSLMFGAYLVGLILITIANA